MSKSKEATAFLPQAESITGLSQGELLNLARAGELTEKWKNGRRAFLLRELHDLISSRPVILNRRHIARC